MFGVASGQGADPGAALVIAQDLLIPISKAAPYVRGIYPGSVYLNWQTPIARIRVGVAKNVFGEVRSQNVESTL